MSRKINSGSSAAPILVTSDEAARIIGIAPKTLVNWRNRGKGPAYVRLGEKHSPVMYRVRDLEAWIDSRVVGAGRGAR
ncbi:helix-turn-helix transcriptional regulator [Thermophilibacter provencensis]|uniref:Helix-turn-helix domain-containing protein n=1 Tax=Thermophilibacter provencensis TaxID=1852386 RepID=A0A921GGF5_9ACTN|nr:helix-turn-helix domain-containing protein [Thermophilibacter provencensis]HJF44593.1 helix-turn-helix domain-containing protein [Thermophilibacter provencensis]